MWAVWGFKGCFQSRWGDGQTCSAVLHKQAIRACYVKGGIRFGADVLLSILTHVLASMQAYLRPSSTAKQGRELLVINGLLTAPLLLLCVARGLIKTRQS